ncbi:MAG TPA: LUD domain-containing protein [Terriglobales bacterium]|nr:LUD domain-containing protein [Terriglobales bacterium]
MSTASIGAQRHLLAQFEAAARTAFATVERVPRSAAALAAAVNRLEPGRIAVAEPLDLPPELFSELRLLPGIVTGRAKSDLAMCDVGVTDVFAGVARTGSVCVTVDHEYAGAISLLSRLHVAVISPETIVERPADLFRPDRLGGKGLTRNFVFITGPSATADMGPLVRGVHGPHKLHVIVLE